MALTMAVVGALGFSLLLIAVRLGTSSSTDVAVWRWLVAHRNDPTTTILTVVTTVSGEELLPVIVAVVAAFVLWRTRRWRTPVTLVAVMVVGLAISTVVKHLVARPRPPVAGMVPPVDLSFSFPSGHTLGAAIFFATAGYLLYCAHRSRGVLAGCVVCAVLLTALVALTRLYLGYHWLTDVLGSVFLALVVVAGAVWVGDGSRGGDPGGAQRRSESASVASLRSP